MNALISQDEIQFAAGIDARMALTIGNCLSFSFFNVLYLNLIVGLTLGHHFGQLLDHCKAVAFLLLSMVKSLTKKDGARCTYSICALISCCAFSLSLKANGDDSSPWQVLSHSNILSEVNSCVFHLTVVFFMLFSSTAASTLVSAALFGLELSPFLLRFAIVASENTFKPFSLPLSRQSLSILLSFVRFLSWTNVLAAYALLPESSAFWVVCIRGALIFRFALDLWSTLRLGRFFVSKGG